MKDSIFLITKVIYKDSIDFNDIYKVIREKK